MLGGGAIIYKLNCTHILDATSLSQKIREQSFNTSGLRRRILRERRKKLAKELMKLLLGFSIRKDPFCVVAGKNCCEMNF